MARYVIKRLLWLIVIIFCGAIIAYTLMYLVPGDPAKLGLSATATKEEIAARAHAIGTDQPFFTQLGKYLFNVFFKFDFGTSWKTDRTILEEFGERLPYTMVIGGVGILLNVIIGTLLGILAAIHEGKWQDSLTMVLAMVLVSAPGFWIALMAQILFCKELRWLSPTGVNTWSWWILPTLCGSLGGIAINARQSRSAMLEVIRADYISTARAKGQIERKVIWKHMLPNALMPIITGVGGGLAMIIAGSPVMEQVFSIPGIGNYMLSGVNQRDRPVVVGCVIFFAAFTGVVMLLTDLAYAFLDPRIKAQYSTRKRAK